MIDAQGMPAEGNVGFKLGKKPEGVAFDPDTRRLYVVSDKEVKL